MFFKVKSYVQRIMHPAKGERGTVAATATLGMACFLGAAGLAIDVSHMFLMGTELQNAADASALAGAAALDGTSGGIKTAVSSAINTVNNHAFGKQQVIVSRNNVTFAANLADFGSAAEFGETLAATALNAPRMRFVKVQLQPHSMPVMFASVFLNTNQVHLSRAAVAGLSINGLGGDPGLNTLCNWVPLCVVQDENGAPLNVNSDCPDKQRFTPGCTYTLRGGTNGGGSDWVSPGNYQALAPQTQNGGGDLRQNMALGVRLCIHPGDIVRTEPGENTGTVRQGLNTRFGDYNGAGLNPNDDPSDTNIKQGITYAQYRSGNPLYTQSSSYANAQPFRRVILIPIIEKSEFDQGRDSQIKIHDLAPFFLRNKVNGNHDIVAEYIGTGYQVGEAYYDPSVNYTGTGRIKVISSPVLYK